MTATRATVEFLISRILRLSPWLLLFAVTRGRRPPKVRI